MKIDPFNITDYNRSQEDLEKFLLFCICVAGKKATMISNKLEEFLIDKDENTLPFDYIRKLIVNGSLKNQLERAKMGKYALLSKAFHLIVNANFDLRNVTAQELEKIPGIGKKTSRFFILHSREKADVAVIDTHMLKYLAYLGYDAGKIVPSGKKYDEYEQIILAEAKKYNMSPAKLDLSIWSWFASGNQGKPEFQTST